MLLTKLLNQCSAKIRRARHAGLAHMTRDEFALLALKSPHWQNIGQGKGKYNFCRRDHNIGYTPENTFIGSAETNIAERIHRCGPPKNPGLNLSPEEKQKRQRDSRRNINRRYYAAQIQNNPHYEKQLYAKRKAAALTRATAKG